MGTVRGYPETATLRDLGHRARRPRGGIGRRAIAETTVPLAGTLVGGLNV